MPQQAGRVCSLRDFFQGGSTGGDVAIVQVLGPLVNHASALDAAWGLTAYDTVQKGLRQAERDHRVRSILLVLDSPGGSAAGATETAAIVRAVSGTKPVVAFVNSLAASAAYAIAAGANEIVTTPSATLGSIGVVWLHVDRSKMLYNAGLKPTFLFAGSAKVDGNSLETLAPNARARIQSLIDETYQLLLTSVGEHRPALGVAGARATEAGLFMGQGAVDAGLADRVGDMKLAVKAAKARTTPRRPVVGAALVASPIASPPGALLATEASYVNRVDATNAAAEAVALERKRIGEILFCAEAKNRQELAQHLALKTDVSPATAVTLLAVAHEEKPRSLLPPRLVPQPRLGIGGPSDGEPVSEFEGGARAAALVMAAAGRPLRSGSPRMPPPAGPGSRDPWA